MARVESFEVEYGLSIEHKGVWHRFGCKINTTVEPDDSLAEVKTKAWNTVYAEVEKQFKNVIETI